MPLRIVRHRGSQNLYLRGTVRGISVFESTRTDDQEAAEQIRIRREAELLERSIHGRRATATFLEAAVRYLEHGGSARFVGTQGEDGKWSGLIGHFGTRRMATITQEHLDAAAKALYPAASPETRNRQCYTPFVAIWNHAAADGLCEVRPWRRPRKAKGTGAGRGLKPMRRGTHAVSYDRARDFVLGMSPAPAIVMTVLFYTGMRPIEVFALEPADVLVENRWIIVRRSKTDEPRGVPMHEFLVPLFKGLKELAIAKGWRHLLFTRKGRPYPLTEDGGGQMKGAIAGAAKRTGINDVSPYTARHTASTQLVVNGIHPHIKDEILGHAVSDMSRRYTHVPQAPLIEAINTLPTFPEWASAPWMADPGMAIGRLVKWSGKGRKREKSVKAST